MTIRGLEPFVITCMCGAKLVVSDASSSISGTRVEPHKCGGWEAWRRILDENTQRVYNPRTFKDLHLHQGV